MCFHSHESLSTPQTFSSTSSGPLSRIRSSAGVAAGSRNRSAAAMPMQMFLGSTPFRRQRAHGTNQPVVGGELPLQVPPHPVERIPELSVSEPLQQILHVCSQFRKVRTVLGGERLGRFQHRRAAGPSDVRVANGLPHPPQALPLPEIGGEGMSHVVDEELALDVEAEGAHGDHVPDLRHRPAEAVPVDGELPVLLDPDPQEVPFLHLRGHHRDHAADGGLHEAHLRLDARALGLAKRLFDELLEVVIRIDQVLTDEDVQRRPDAGSPAPAQSQSDGTCDARQDVHPHGGRHHLRLPDLLRDSLQVEPVHRPHVLDHQFGCPLVRDEPDRIGPIGVQLRHQLLIDVYEHHLVTTLGQQLADDPARCCRRHT